jgi:hypothetical protein
VALCASVPPLPESSYAAEGTRAHELAAYCLKNGFYNVGSELTDDMPGDMLAAVQVYLDAVYAEMAKSATAELYVETSFTFASVGDGQEVYGSNDAIVYHPELKRLVVFDYKHGVGVSVSAEDNSQLKFYAAGAYLSSKWKVSEVELVIVQPRARDADEVGAVKRWPMDVLELVNFAGELQAGVMRAKNPEEGVSSLKTGPWCRWCDAAPICPAKEKQALEALTLDYRGTIVDLKPEQLLDPHTIATDTIDGGERIAKILAGIEVANAWANQIREFVEAHMIAGTMVFPGWKVVEKIGRRKIVAPEAKVVGYAGAMFGLEEDDIHPRKLATLTEIEKLLKAAGASKADIDDFMLKFTAKESSGLTIAPTRDRRPAVNAAEKAFSGVKL